MGLLSGLMKGIGSIFKAPLSIIKSVGSVPGSVLGLAKKGITSGFGGVKSLLGGISGLVPKLLPLAASMAPMLAGLPPMPGLANIFAPQQKATPQNLLTHVIPQMGQAAFAGMPAPGLGVDPRMLLQNLGGMPGGTASQMSLLRLMSGLQPQGA